MPPSSRSTVALARLTGCSPGSNAPSTLSTGKEPLPAPAPTIVASPNASTIAGLLADHVATARVGQREGPATRPRPPLTDNPSGTTTSTDNHASATPIAAQPPKRRKISTSTKTSDKNPAAVVAVVSEHAAPTPRAARTMAPSGSSGVRRRSSCTLQTQCTASAIATTGSSVK